MKKLLYMAAALSTLAVVGCKQEEIQTFSDLNDGLGIYFYNPTYGFTNLNFGSYDSYNDSLETSFFLFSGKDEITLNLTVSRSGYSEDDTRFSVAVEPEGTTAVASEYEIPSSCVFPGGEQTATFPVVLKHSARVDTDTLRLVVKLVDGGDYLAATPTKSLKVINFHNQVMKPAWWTGPQIQTNSLGPFSRKKYELLMMVSDNYPFDETTSVYLIREFALKLKQYLREQRLAGNTIYEEDGTEMTIPAGGY
ncbi:MAG: DUF4843 domain-containing protein [Bacteroidales bacterium]|nr:DUF4843 domain-containing protein [Bacteroidales bacterium]